ncbi:MAG: Uma2 family endonuclease [Bryobacteraceae bacterium]
MMGSAAAILSFEEFEQLPGQPGKQELIDGELIEMPPPKLRHSLIQRRLFRLVEEYLTAHPDLGEAFFEAGFRLGLQNWVQPDVSVVSAQQIREAGEYLQGAPAIAIEVISRSSNAETVDGKIAHYFGHGGLEVWVLYPKTRRVWVYHRDGTAAEHRDRIRSSVRPGFEADLAVVLAA